MVCCFLHWRTIAYFWVIVADANTFICTKNNRAVLLGIRAGHNSRKIFMWILCRLKTYEPVLQWKNSQLPPPKFAQNDCAENDVCKRRVNWCLFASQFERQYSRLILAVTFVYLRGACRIEGLVTRNNRLWCETWCVYLLNKGWKFHHFIVYLRQLYGF